VIDLVIPRKNLRPILARCLSVTKTAKQGPPPWLHDHVLVGVTSNSLSVTATNERWSLTSSTWAEVAGTGSVLVKPEMMHAALDQIEDGPVRTTTDQEHNVTVRTLGTSRQIALHGMAGNGFPKSSQAPDVEPVKVPLGTFADLLTKTRRAMSEDKTKPHVNALYLHASGDRLRAWSTDGCRCHMADAQVLGLESFPAVILPRGAVFKLRALVEQARKTETGGAVQVQKSDTHAFFRIRGSLLSIKLVDARFPPCDQVVPKHLDVVATVPREEFRRCLIAVAQMLDADDTMALAGPNWRQVALTFDKNVLHIETMGCGGSFSDRLPVKYNGPRFVCPYASTYMRDAIDVIETDEVEIVVPTKPAEPVIGETQALPIGDPLEPLVLQPAGNTSTDASFLAVLMPVRP
jgi:DNA polymerase III subunit beta